MHSADEHVPNLASKKLKQEYLPDDLNKGLGNTSTGHFAGGGQSKVNQCKRKQAADKLTENEVSTPQTFGTGLILRQFYPALPHKQPNTECLLGTKKNNPDATSHSAHQPNKRQQSLFITQFLHIN